MATLVERLRRGAEFHESEGDIGLPAILREAADEIDRLYAMQYSMAHDLAMATNHDTSTTTRNLTDQQLKQIMMATAGACGTTSERAEEAAERVLADLADPDSIVRRYILGSAS